MLGYLLNVLYLALLVIASPWLVYQAIRTGKYRQGFAAKFLGRVPPRQSSRPCIWLHAVSVGEVNLLKPLMAELTARHPDWECVVSTTTMTGYALAKSRYPALSVFYCPLDFTWSVRAAMRRIRPALLLLAELELWPNLIAAARAAGARVAIVNGRLSDHSFHGYRCARPLVGHVLRQIDLLAVQNHQYADRFLALGAAPRSVYVTGSVKFDGAQTDRSNAATAKLRQLAGIAPADVVFLAGSTQDPEEAAALAAFREVARDFPQLRLIIVPRHPERFDAAAELLTASGLPWQRRSALDTQPANPLARVLLVDRIGELAAWWGTAHIAFVGGSLGKRGGQNMIEPAAYGAAVSFGPNTHNFRDIVSLLLDQQAAIVVHNGAELTAFLRRCLNDPPWASALGTRAQQVVAANLGATRRTINLLESLMPRTTAVPRTRDAA